MRPISENHIDRRIVIRNHSGMRIAPIASVSCQIILLLFCGLLPSKAVDGPLTPEEAQKAFKLEPNLKIELVAAEPNVVDPVAIAFDEKGRMYVAEDRGYPTGPGKGNPPAGKIALLEDLNNDGVFEKRTTFAEGLTFPNGVMCWKGGVYVTCAPDLFYFKDIDGDGKADVKQVIFKGFQDLSTTQLRESHPTLNIDNWIYLNCGLTAAKVTSPDCTNRGTLLVNRVDFRFKPGTCEYEEYSGTGQFGGTFDPLGRRFICSNRNHNQHVVMQARYLRRNPNLSFAEYVQDTPDHGAACKLYPLSHNITTAASHTGFFTSACGLLIYTGQGLPPAYWGNSFTCEPAGNLIHRDILDPSGVTFVAKRAFPTNEFVVSPDNWFRPVNLANGPDGALYICDMYRKTIEHPEYLPEATRKLTDFESGKDRGRIWRVAPTLKRHSPRQVNFMQFSPKELAMHLENPDGWWRMTAHRLLLERKDPKSIPHLKQVAKSARHSEAKIQALYLLNEMGVLDEDMLLAALSDARPPVREHALQLAEPRFAKSVKLVDAAVLLAADTNHRVRFQCALSLGEINDAKIVPPLVKIVMRDGPERWTRAAVLSSIANHPHEFLRETIVAISLLMKRNSGREYGLAPFLSELGKVLGSDKKQDRLAGLKQIVSTDQLRDSAWQLPLLSGYAEGLRSGHTNTGSQSPLMTVVAGDSAAQVRVESMLKLAAEQALDGKISLERRLICINLLGHGSYAQVSGVLQKLIDPQQPNELQIAAVRALGQMPDPQVGPALVKREQWTAYTQTVKDAVLAMITSQPRLLDDLLSAIEKGNLSARSITPEKRNQLMKHKDPAISKRATELFKDMAPGDRMKVFEEYKSILTLKPEKENGHKMFSKTCASCHVFSGEGHAVGPDLTGIRNQPADVLLMHIIVPELEIMPIYTQYNIETKDGLSVSGIMASETPSSVTIKQALGVTEVIQRSNIASMTSSSLSIMPQELEKTMSKQELADLLGFLKGE